MAKVKIIRKLARNEAGLLTIQTKVSIKLLLKIYSDIKERQKEEMSMKKYFEISLNEIPSYLRKIDILSPVSCISFIKYMRKNQ